MLMIASVLVARVLKRLYFAAIALKVITGSANLLTPLYWSVSELGVSLPTMQQRSTEIIFVG